jgi:hypothetical protein
MLTLEKTSAEIVWHLYISKYVSGTGQQLNFTTKPFDSVSKSSEKNDFPELFMNLNLMISLEKIVCFSRCISNMSCWGEMYQLNSTNLTILSAVTGEY